MEQEIIYFDNAATSFPKPQSVIDATIDCMENYCGNSGRGSHIIAMRSAQIVYDAREALADMFGSSPENVVFTLNTTYALNMAIKGILKHGGHALISNMEHNSVLRPIHSLARSGSVSYDIFPVYQQNASCSKKEIMDGIISRLRPDTKLLVCLHSSNICSYSLPIYEIGQLCSRYGILFVLDGAQSAGHLPINMNDNHIDVLCMPAHKGLYSPQGLGIMMLREGLSIETLIEGGNGVNSLSREMGFISPERYEGGTLCTPAIAGLKQGLNFLNEIGISSIESHEKRLYRIMHDELSQMKKITVYAPQHEGGVLLFNIDGITADDLGKELSENGFCLRTGYHCSPLAHKALNTADGGAVRASFGIFNTQNQVTKLCDTIYRISRELQ